MDASARTGVAFDYLVDQARIESGFRADAKASTSSASGLYQFTGQTWLATLKRHGSEHGFGWAADAIELRSGGRFVIADPAMRDAIFGLRDDAAASALMAGELAADNAAQLRQSLGREPEAVDLYLAHFLGADGARRFLAAWQVDPEQPAAPLLPAAAAANRAIFYTDTGLPRSLGAIRSRFAAKFESGAAVPAIDRQDRAPATTAPRPPLAMFEIKAMPRKLSLAFASEAYRRLQAVAGRTA